MSYLNVAGVLETTAANLANVIAGETREYTRTYPRMINDAMLDGRDDAVDAFTQAMAQEKEHQIAFSRCAVPVCLSAIRTALRLPP